MNSKKKHNILFTKPSEPAFLTRLKQQAGYLEGPNVDTKREKMPELPDDEDYDEKEDEKPVVVVMNDGDLTEEEANVHTKIQETQNKIQETQKEQKKQEEVVKADLSQRIIFKRKKNTEDSESAESSDPKAVKKKKSAKPAKTVLSFNDEEEEE